MEVDERDTSAQVPSAAMADVSGDPLAAAADSADPFGLPPSSQFSSGLATSRASLAAIDQLLEEAQAAAEEEVATARVASAHPKARQGGRVLKRPASRSAPVPPPWRQAVFSGETGGPSPAPRVPVPRPQRIYGSAGDFFNLT